jgi:hypothetical protein
VELPFDHTDVNTVIGLIADIRDDVRDIRRLLEDEDGDEEEVPEEPDG